MPTYNAQQRAAIRDFVDATGAKDSVAVKQLKASGWNLNSAVDTYFQMPTPSTARSSMKPALNKVFDKYRDDAATPDQIGAEGTMKYLQEIKVSLEEPAMLAVLTQVKAPTMGELTRSDFISGWEEVSADTVEKQKTQVGRFRTSLRNDPDFFRNVYRHSFFLARSPGQKSVALEAGIEFWRMLFSASNGMDWSSRGFNWLEHFITYLQDKWKKSIGKDLWDQTLFFARKTIADPSLSWWNEMDSAWPSVLDEFANHVKSLPEYVAKLKPQTLAGDGMDTGE